MLLNPFLALVNSFPRIFIIKSKTNNKRNPHTCRFSATMTHFPNIYISFINEEVTGYINEEVIGVINEAAIGAIMAL